MAPRTTCGSHDMMVDLVKEQRETMDKTKDEISTLSVRVAMTEVEVKNLITQFQESREEDERHNSAITERLDRLYSLVERRNRWRPQHFVALISTAMLSAGTVFAAFISRGGAK